MCSACESLREALSQWLCDVCWGRGEVIKPCSLCSEAAPPHEHDDGYTPCIRCLGTGKHPVARLALDAAAAAPAAPATPLIVSTAQLVGNREAMRALAEAISSEIAARDARGPSAPEHPLPDLHTRQGGRGGLVGRIWRLLGRWGAS